MEADHQEEECRLEPIISKNGVVSPAWKGFLKKQGNATYEQPTLCV